MNADRLEDRRMSEHSQPPPDKPGWQIKETRGTPITAFGHQLVPIGRAIHVRWPGGGFVWHRPIAIETHQGNGTHRVPIHDPTRRAMRAIALTGLLIAALAAAWSRWQQLQTRRSV